MTYEELAKEISNKIYGFTDAEGTSGFGYDEDIVVAIILAELKKNANMKENKK